MAEDEQKAKVLNALLLDSDRPRKQIAQHLGISESYVSKIIKELVVYDKLITRFSVEPNYNKLGYNTHAVTFLKLEQTSERNIAEFSQRVSEINDAIEVYTVFGEWDIYIRWLSKTPADIMKNINRVITYSAVAKIETLTLGEQYKKNFGPLIENESI